MRPNHFLCILGLLFLFVGHAHADAPLAKQLDLTTDQAKQVKNIQKQYRKKFSAGRQELNRESRKLRRARTENDSSKITQQEKTTEKLRQELKQIRLDEDEEIRRLLTAEQRIKFEQVIQQRKDMVGSSRDVKSL